MAVNGFSEADLRTLPAATIRARLVDVQAAISKQLLNGTAIEEYSIEGRSVKKTSLEFLTMYEAALYRALGVQAAEPDGLGIGLARFGDVASDGGSASRGRGL